MLLNLLAALSLASVGAVAGIVSNRQSVDDVELDKSSLIVRKNAFAYIDGKLLNYFALPPMPGGVDNPTCLLDVTLQSGTYFEYSSDDAWLDSSNGFHVDLDGNDIYVDLILDGTFSGYQCLLSGIVLDFDESTAGEDSFVGYYCIRFTGTLPNDYFVPEFWHVALVYGADNYIEDHQILSGIASGLTSVQHYAASLVSGFDALALDNGALTNSMAFAFTLLGIGTAVGICKLTFNWITGRHGM